MRYYPFPSHIQIVCEAGGKNYYGLNVPFQPWLSGQVGRNSDILPMIPGDQLVVELKTARGSHVITPEKFFEIMGEVLKISGDFYSRSALRCCLTVSASGEVAVKYGDETAERFCGNHLIFLLNRLCIDLEEKSIMCIPQLSQFDPYPKELLLAASEQVKQLILELIN